MKNKFLRKSKVLPSVRNFQNFGFSGETSASASASAEHFLESRKSRKSFDFHRKVSKLLAFGAI